MKYVALSAIEEYNDRNGTTITYQDVATLSTDHLWSPEGEWVVYTDRPHELVLSCRALVEETQLADGDCRVSWILFWDVPENILTVYRSPHIDYKASIAYPSLTEGMSRTGDCPSFTLPPEIEGAILQDLQEPEEEPKPKDPERREEHVYFDGRQLNRR